MREKVTGLDECLYCGEKCALTDVFCSDDCKTSYVEEFANELESHGNAEEANDLRRFFGIT